MSAWGMIGNSKDAGPDLGMRPVLRIRVSALYESLLKGRAELG